MASVKRAQTVGQDIIAAAVFVSAVGCGSREQILTGPVTALTPTFCVGANFAAGDCFDVSASKIDGIKVGDCVLVTYRQADNSARPSAKTVTKVATASSAANCPDAGVG